MTRQNLWIYPRYLYGVLFVLFLSTAPNVTAQQDFQALLADVDALVSYPDNDFSAEYTIVHDRPGRGRRVTSAAIFRRDAQEKYVIIVLQPEAQKGQGYLKQGETLWFYDPDSRRFNFTSSKERFQNTNARNSDFTRSTLAQDYEVVASERATLGKYDCWLLDLEANNDGVTYPFMRVWIDQDNLIRKSEDYSLSRQLLRTSAFPDYQTKNGLYIPRRVLFVDHLAGTTVDGKFVNEKTQINIDKVSLELLPNSVFSKTFLENVNQ